MFAGSELRRAANNGKVFTFVRGRKEIKQDCLNQRKHVYVHASEIWDFQHFQARDTEMFEVMCKMFLFNNEFEDMRKGFRLLQLVVILFCHLLVFYAAADFPAAPPAPSAATAVPPRSETRPALSCSPCRSLLLTSDIQVRHF